MVREGGPAPVWGLVTVATAGNVLGSWVNWLLGLYLLKFKGCRWFYFKEPQIAKAQQWFNRYGVWTLLFAWVPLGGDALTLVAGIMRVPWPLFLVLVGIGKLARYIVVVQLVQMGIAAATG
jgi:membrane protein YqaA with SNARE-associated domain